MGVKPLVSIGVPLYNAEKYARRIKNLWRQTYANFEVIISDNGSTDRTVPIVKAALRGKRNVLLLRSLVNRGAPWNFNRVFRQARGRYFLWASLDDCREPNFIAQCVDVLEKNPDVALAVPAIHVFIEGQPRCLYTVDVRNASRARTLSERYGYALQRFPAVALYGIYRSAALRRTGLMSSIPGGDLLLIEDLALQGGIRHVPKTRLYYFGRPRWNTADENQRAAVGDAGRRSYGRPGVQLAKEKIRRLSKAKLALGHKLSLSLMLALHLQKKILMRASCLILGVIPHAAARCWLLERLYWACHHDPVMRIKDTDLYRRRIIFPMMGLEQVRQ